MGRCAHPGSLPLSFLFLSLRSADDFCCFSCPRLKIALSLNIKCHATGQWSSGPVVVMLGCRLGLYWYKGKRMTLNLFFSFLINQTQASITSPLQRASFSSDWFPLTLIREQMIFIHGSNNCSNYTPPLVPTAWNKRKQASHIKSRHLRKKAFSKARPAHAFVRCDHCVSTTVV